MTIKQNKHSDEALAQQQSKRLKSGNLYGPHGYSGKASTLDKGEVQYTADEILHRTTFIKLWDWPYTDTTREKANRTIERILHKAVPFRYSDTKFFVEPTLPVSQYEPSIEPIFHHY